MSNEQKAARDVSIYLFVNWVQNHASISANVP